MCPCFAQDMGVKEFQAIEIQFDRAPGMRIKQSVEIIKALIFVQVVNFTVEIIADPPDGPSIGLNGFGLQTCQFQALKMLSVIGFECWILRDGNVHCNLRLKEWGNGRSTCHCGFDRLL